MYTHNWQVTGFDKNGNGKVTTIHYVLESSIGDNKAFSYGSYKVREKLGVPDEIVTNEFLVAHLLKHLPPSVRMQHEAEIIRVQSNHE